MKKTIFVLISLIVGGKALAANSLNCTVTQQTEDGENVIIQDKVFVNQHKTSQNGDISLFMSNSVTCAADGGPCLPGPGETSLLLTIGKVSLRVYASGAGVTDQTLTLEDKVYQVRCLVMPAN